MAGQAPGRPGLQPRWTSSDKMGVGTALSARSRVWFTLSHGILNEVYFPRVDRACTRDLGLIVTNGRDFFSEEKRDTTHRLTVVEDGVPAYRVANICNHGRYRIDKCVISHPHHDAVLQQIRLTALQGALEDYRLFVLLAPHLVNGGADNTAWLGEYKGVPMLFAEGDGTALALASTVPWRARSVGFVGSSDGWQDLSRNFQLTWGYDRADLGNVAMAGEIGIGADGAVLSLAFGADAEEAGYRARTSLQDGFEESLAGYVANWRGWQQTLRPLDAVLAPGARNDYRISTAVLRTHESPTFPGGLIASMSIPWGFSKGDDDLGGYHLVWPRDLVETAGGLLAAGAGSDARRVLDYLQATQEPDGHWPQNSWLDGTPYWQGVQMDECAFPILLLDLAWRESALSERELARYWPMAERAAAFLVQNGPVTGQDRWEEDGGYSPFTLAVEVAALLAAADLAELHGEPGKATFLRETADCWNHEIEWWTFATGTPLAQQLGISGYYVRIAPPEQSDAASPVNGFVPIKNRPPEDTDHQATQIVSPDALALVRFGLRSPSDPRILDTVKAIDALLKVELPQGPCWRRYNDDGYGEHEDGRPFDGTGIGRAWPLLTGERAHFELAAGRVAEATRLLHVMEACATMGGMLPEQVWDAADIPERELYRGRPTGSAMPLVWAHSEHIKLRRSLIEGRVFDMPPQTVKRYLEDHQQPRLKLWRTNSKASRLPAGRVLRLELGNPTKVHWSADGWRTVTDSMTTDSGLGLHVVELPTADLVPGQSVVFTLYDLDLQSWAGVDYVLTVE